MQQNKTRVLVECAVMVALASALSMLKIYDAPLGGSVTLFSMAPLIAVAFRQGPRWGFAASFVYSIIQLLLGLGSVSYVPTARGIVLCILLDYIIPFTLIGVAGFFRPASDGAAKSVSNSKRLVLVAAAALTVCVLRFISHLLSGAVVWYEITKAGQWNELVMKTGMWTYSAIYNASYMIPETLITLVASPAIAFVLASVGRDRTGGGKTTPKSPQ